MISEAPDGSLRVEPIKKVSPLSWETRERLLNLAFLLPEFIRSASANALIAQHSAADILHASALGNWMSPLQKAATRSFEAAALELPEELLVARGLLAPETGYLESGTPEALATLRESLGGVRKEIRVARAELRAALRRGEHEAVTLFASRLGDTIDNAEDRISNTTAERKLKRTKVLMAAAGTLGFTAASTLFPLIGLPILAAGTTVAGLFWGASLIDAWKEMRVQAGT